MDSAHLKIGSERNLDCITEKSLFCKLHLEKPVLEPVQLEGFDICPLITGESKLNSIILSPK